MKLDDAFKTRTMARILAKQGQFQKAVHIYGYLLEKNPDREDIKAELSALKREMNGRHEKGGRDLVPLYREWILLSFHLNSMTCENKN